MRLGGGSKYLLIMIYVEQSSPANHDSLLLGALGDESDISDFPFTQEYASEMNMICFTGRVYVVYNFYDLHDLVTKRSSFI